DDNENNLLLMTSLLEYLLPDSEIFTSENGKDAIEKYRANKPDIIFMDIQMPIMDGIEATKLLKEKYFSTKHVPIIAITAGSIKGERERCLGLGMDDFLNKPIVQEEFIKVLKKWLSTSKPNLSSLRKLTETGTSHQHFNFSELSQNLFHNQPLIETLIKRTMDEIEFYIRDCQKFIELKDLVSLKKRTHKLKGSASNVFFEVLSGKLNRIEHLKEEDFSQYIDLLKEIEEEFSILVQIDLDRIFKKNGVRVR
ncbi:MAG: response regulator, partial [Leptospiraceae bacterium]|nr:response regulator [Leptospiraceae bacterium]